MKIHLHDDKPAKPGEPHGPDGPTHCGSVTVDYEYQVEMWAEEIGKDYSHVVYMRSPDLQRAWRRNGKVMEEVPYLEVPGGVVLTDTPEA